MAIQINYYNCKGAEETAEMHAAKEIGWQFEQDFKKYDNVEGTLHIFCSNKLYGYSVSDLDLIVFADFKNFKIQSNFDRCKIWDKNCNDIKIISINELEIENFICIIELKDLSPEYVSWETTKYWGYYDNTDTQKDLTEQTEKQKHSLRNFLFGEMKIRPYVASSIYFRSISLEELDRIRQNVRDNALASNFHFEDLINVILLQANVKYYHDNYHLNSFGNYQIDIQKLLNFWCTKREAKGLTRKKFEAITNDNVVLDDLIDNENSKFTLLPGRAGTGKTIHLIQLALKLVQEKNARCLLLTYNNALVSDIRRLLDYMDIPTKVDAATVNIQSRDSFFLDILQTTGIVPSGYLMQYDNTIKNGLIELNKKLSAKLADYNVKTIKEIPGCNIDWDYILIDEAQDWEEIHKEILFKIYGAGHLIVADGVDQFVSSYSKLDWKKGCETEINSLKELTLERRQKSTLARFVNDYARKLGIDWNVQVNNNLPGGSVKIYNKYNSDIHIRLYDDCQVNDCEQYDILILVPPQSMEEYVDEEDGEKKKRFSKAAAYAKAGIDLYDGTQPDNRQLYPSLDKARLFQYDSCRGLEGWSVVCQDFDLLIDYKMNDPRIVIPTLGLDAQRAKRDFVYLWSIIPLTRAIDTLIITLNNPNSEIGRILHELSQEVANVEWCITE